MFKGANAGGLIASGVTVGTTTIISGTTGRILYDNAGVLGEIASGTGVVTALAVDIGSAGAFVTFNGALGTPSSGTGTNITGVNAAALGGATFAAPGAIGGGTPSTGVFSTLTGLNLEVFKTANADSPLTGAQASGTIVSNFGMTDADCTIALPTAAAGYGFMAILPAVRAHFFKFQAGATDKIYLSGVAGSNNGLVGVASGYATGASCSFFTFKASDGGFDWFAVPIFGTWVAS